MITRETMERTIAGGGSVLYHGIVISSIADLPSVAALAQGDPAKEAVAIAALTAQMQALQADIARLRPAFHTVQEPQPQTPDIATLAVDVALARGRANK